jgi:biopolymer transport protein ExbB
MGMEVNVLEVLRTSFTLWILIACSILALAVMTERLWYFWRIKIDANWFAHQVKQLIQARKDEEVAALCEKYPVPIANLFKSILSSGGQDKEAMEELAMKVQLEEKMRAERYLGILGTLGSMTPFIGLFGTVVGIIRAFHQLSVGNAAGGASVVAAGISEALVATAAGLLVAIPCIVLFNYFSGQVRRVVGELEIATRDFIVFISHQIKIQPAEDLSGAQG